MRSTSSDRRPPQGSQRRDWPANPVSRRHGRLRFRRARGRQR